MSVCLVCLDPDAPDSPAAPYHALCLERLFRSSHVPRIELDRATLPMRVQQRLVGKVSISGIQPKALARLSDDGRALEVVEQAGPYIVKPQTNRYLLVPENEHLTMRLARLVGLPVPENGLFLLEDRSIAYVIKRFDRTADDPPRKRRQLDFCMLANKHPDEKYDGSAEECAKLLYRYAEDPEPAARQLFRQWLLSYWVGNGDLHLKNLSLLEDDTGALRLSPVYDLISTWIYGDRELAMPLGGKKKNVTRRNWLEYAETHCRIPRAEAQSILNNVLDRHETAIALLDRSALSEPKLKESYHDTLEKRGRALAGASRARAGRKS